MTVFTDAHAKFQEAQRQSRREQFRKANPNATEEELDAIIAHAQTGWSPEEGGGDGQGGYGQRVQPPQPAGGGGIFGAIDDTFSQEQVNPYNANRENFALGGRTGYADERAGFLQKTGDDTAIGTQQQGYGGQLQARSDASRLGSRGMDLRAGAASDAAGYGSAGYGQAQAAGFDATGYANAGDAAADSAKLAATTYGAAARNAQTRIGPQIDTTDADFQADQAQQARALGFDSRGLQMQDRGEQYGAVGRVRDYYQQGPGPSAAEAQLNMGAEKNMAAALAMARSGRGAGVDANAERQAMFQNAATGQELNQQMGLLRAQESDAWRGRQLQAMGLEQSGLGNIAGQDAGIRQGDMQLRAQDLQAQGMSFEQAQAQAQMEADQRARNDQMTIAMRQLQESASGRGAQTGLNYAQLAEQARSRGMTAEQFFAQMQEEARARGDQTALSYDQIGAQRQGQGDDFLLGMTGMGLDHQLGMYGLAQQGIEADQRGGISYEQTQAESINAARQQNAAADAKRDASNQGLVMALAAAAASSDIRAKKEIKLEDIDEPEQLENTKRALAPAPYEAPRPRSDPNFDYDYDFDPAPSAAPQGGGGGGGGIMDSIMSLIPSDEHTKERLRDAEAELAQFKALGGGEYPETQQPDTDALDQAYSEGQGGSFDHRPARGYSYEYKEPDRPGAAPGRQYGPMAQDLLKSPATASTVKQTPGGLAVDTSRLALVNTAAIGQQQREQDELERQVAALLAAQGQTERGIRSPRAVYPGGF